MNGSLPNDGVLSVHLEALARQLGVAVERIWGAYVQQMYMEGIADAAAAFIMLAAVIIGLRIFIRRYRKAFGSKNDREAFAILMVSTVLAAVAAMGLLVAIENNILQVINPEYYAAKEILKAVAR